MDTVIMVLLLNLNKLSFDCSAFDVYFKYGFVFLGNSD